MWDIVAILVIAFLGVAAMLRYLDGPKKPSKEYCVDERPMCVVVRKRTVREMFNSFQDIDPESPHVVAYWEGDEIKTLGMPVRYIVHKWQINKAKELCQRLNGV